MESRLVHPLVISKFLVATGFKIYPNPFPVSSFHAQAATTITHLDTSSEALLVSRSRLFSWIPLSRQPDRSDQTAAISGSFLT